MSDPIDNVAGWTFPTPQSRKCHWFDSDDLRSLCGKYMLLRRNNHMMHADDGRSKDDCVACRRKLDARATS